MAQVLPPNCDHVGQLIVGAIGSPPELFDHVWLSQVDPEMFRGLLAPRPADGHKGTFGHVLVVAGSHGKTGAAAMSGLGALRAGAGLVTVASAESAISGHSRVRSGIDDGRLARARRLGQAPGRSAKGKTVIAMGPGMGRSPQTEELVARAVREFAQPMVIDADALVSGAGGLASGDNSGGRTAGPYASSGRNGPPDRQDDRRRAEGSRRWLARAFAMERKVTLVLKGQRTVIAFPDGRVWINPTGSPAMGNRRQRGDILTGLIAGFLAQFPKVPDVAVAAAVYLHGLAGQIGAKALGEKCLIATDLLEYLPDAMEECADVSDNL